MTLNFDGSKKHTQKQECFLSGIHTVKKGLQQGELAANLFVNHIKYSIILFYYPF